MINNKKNRARCKARIYACGDHVRLQIFVATIIEAGREDFIPTEDVSPNTSKHHMWRYRVI
jgi:hypothetical protein